MFPEPTELLFDRINLDPKIQIKYIDIKNQLADTRTKGNFTRDEWNHHLLCLLNISHFSSTDCSEVMSKRTRVTTKSKPMMNLVSRYSVRDPNVLSLTASESPEKTKSESQNVPPSSLNVQQRDLFMNHHPAFSQSTRTDWLLTTMIWTNTVAESDMSSKARSFLHKVNDRV